MENIVLTIGGLLKSFTWSDAFFFTVTFVLLLVLIYVVYLVKIDDSSDIELSESKPNDNDQGLIDVFATPQTKVQEDKPLSKIVSELETNYKPEQIDLSEYEKEQEDTAIISYEELVKRASNNIYYDDEYDSGFDDVLVQKIDNKESSTKELVNLPQAVMMSYESEEAFLSALKVLQKNLVR
jgi:hypothetical protein